jgi:hypothetical protein
MNRTITPTEVAAAIVVARARVYVEAMQDATAVEADHPEYKLRRDRVVKSFLALQDSTETYRLAADEHLQTAIRGLRQKAAEGAQG